MQFQTVSLHIDVENTSGRGTPVKYRVNGAARFLKRDLRGRLMSGRPKQLRFTNQLLDNVQLPIDGP